MQKAAVFFLPPWPANPYQSILAGFLATHGYRVEMLAQKKFFIGPVLKNRGAGILHIHSPNGLFLAKSRLKASLLLMLSLVQLLVLRMVGLRIVWTVHDLKNHENRLLWLDRICTWVIARVAGALIVHCKKAGDLAVEYLKLKNSAKVHVIHHGTFQGYYSNTLGKDEARRRLNISDEAVVFLFFGMIRAYKGVAELVDAFERLDNVRAHLLIAGNPASMDVKNILLSRLSKVEQHTLEAHFISDAEIQLFMNACDVVVLPFRDILTSGSLVLAISFGRACIAPGIGCIPEMVGDDGGIMYEANDPDGLFNAMQTAMDNAGLLQHMGERNKRISEQWNWSDVAKSTAKVYAALL